MEIIQPKKRKEENRNIRVKWKTGFKMAINTCLSIITLNVNGLNAPIKKHRVADWIKKQKHSICCLQETHLRAKDTYRLKVSLEARWQKSRGTHSPSPTNTTTTKTHLQVKRLAQNSNNHWQKNLNSNNSKNLAT